MLEEANLKMEVEPTPESGLHCYEWYSCFRKDPEISLKGD
jgi:hypothetical protein